MNFKVKSAEFVTSVHNVKDIPRKNLPEFAFAGRSNVGKSSLINNALNRKKLAKISSTPGKTRSINYFEINSELYFVDLPGYGYAKLPDSEKIKWKNLIESYFYSSKRLKLVIILIDSRTGMTTNDKILIDWIEHLSLPFILVITKADKISNNKYQQCKAEIQKETGKNITIIKYSIYKEYGREELWKEICDRL